MKSRPPGPLSVLWADRLAPALIFGMLTLPVAAGDRTQSPYFFVPGEQDVEQFPLESTAVTVEISGVLANVFIEQRYRNGGQRPIEAVYVFPASVRAAVYAMEFQIGERTIRAEVRTREGAREAYRAALAEGRRGALLEQQRANVFQTRVANIQPGDEVAVRLRYFELLLPSEGIYEFAFPTVVAPRYGGQNGGGPGWELRYLESEAPPGERFELQLSLQAPLPIQDLGSPSHPIRVWQPAPASARVELDVGEDSPAGRDFVLRYRLSGDGIQSGTLFSREGEENFFLLLVEPPRTVREEAVLPREMVFVVDVSGSMKGFPLDITRQLMRDLVEALHQTDRFNLILFAGGSTVLWEQSRPATPENLRAALAALDSQEGTGGTELGAALGTALDLPRPPGRLARSIVLLTDGLIQSDSLLLREVAANLGQANVFTFGIGESVNRFLIEGLARVGRAESFVVLNPEEAPAWADRFRRYVRSPLLSQIRLEAHGLEALEIEPAALPDLMGERPLVVTGKWRGEPAGTITLSGWTSEGPWQRSMDTATGRWSSTPLLGQLWARERIRSLELEDSTPENIREVEQLGLRFQLLSRQTSFVAVDSEPVSPEQAITVTQPVSLPMNGRAGPMLSVQNALVVTSSGSRSTFPDARVTTDGFPVGLGVSTEEGPADPVTVQISEQGLRGRLLRRVDPVLDESAGPLGRTVYVVMEVVVNRKGRVSRVKVIQGDPRVNRAAVKAVRQWRFEPLERNGERVRMLGTITLKFGQ